MRPQLLLIWMALAPMASGAELGDLDWLAGHWTRAREGGLMHESWQPPQNGVMRGNSWMTRDGSDAEIPFESLCLLQLGDDVYFVAHPRENAYPTAFRMIESGESRAVFENTAHDFPQRILYERADDELLAAIEGPGSDGQTRRVEFPFRRAATGD